jgi:hypothetical protein
VSSNIIIGLFMARGDRIYVYRQLMNLDGVYQHHGIDCGDGTVIHYRKPSEVVERTSFEVFSKGNLVYIQTEAAEFRFVSDVVIQRAESRLGEDRYNLLFNNCEHFTTWCKTGISDSKQVREFAPIVSKLNTYKLFSPLEEALKETDSNNADRLVDRALVDIRAVWEQIQPQYKLAIEEVESWQKVAWEAVKRDREDLARGALMRKNQSQQRAKELKEQLDHLTVLVQQLTP